MDSRGQVNQLSIKDFIQERLRLYEVSCLLDLGKDMLYEWVGHDLSW